MFIKSSKAISSGNRGYTVIEMSLVLLLAGFLFAAFLSAYKAYSVSKNDKVTLENMNLAQEALREFFGLYGHYPRPADPSLAPGDINYGMESDYSALNPYPAGCPPGLLCETIGARDVDGNPSTVERVLIGALPGQYLEQMGALSKFRAAHAIDGYGMKITYAVTEEMTRDIYDILNPVNNQAGAVAIRDENDRPLVDPPDSAHYVLVSHGQNKRGAFNVDGQQVGDCNVTVIVMGSPVTGPAPPGSNLLTAGIDTEIENCDRNDAVFSRGLRSLANNGNYFDDIVYFNANTAMALWRVSNANPANIYSANLGNVGVGTRAPTSKFQVSGNLRAGTEMSADDGFCAPWSDGQTDDDCVEPEKLGGNAMIACPAGEVAVGIESTQVVCEPLFTNPITIPDCPAGEFLTGFTVTRNTGTGVTSLSGATCATP